MTHLRQPGAIYHKANGRPKRAQPCKHHTEQQPGLLRANKNTFSRAARNTLKHECMTCLFYIDFLALSRNLSVDNPAHW